MVVVVVIREDMKSNASAMSSASKTAASSIVEVMGVVTEGADVAVMVGEVDDVVVAVNDDIEDERMVDDDSDVDVDVEE